MSTKDRLMELGLTLPPPPEPAGAYTRAVRVGELVFVAGQLPVVDGEVVFGGKVGGEVSVDEGYQASRLCALNALSILEAEAGGLDHIARIVRLTGFVCSADGFTQQAAVVNGASELMAEVFGQRGVHARLAVGVVGLPLGAAVELEVIAQTG
ncbi:RidA family protein [Candidatus Latescibacterota bacterium]